MTSVPDSVGGKAATSELNFFSPICNNLAYGLKFLVVQLISNKGSLELSLCTALPTQH